MTRRHLDPGPRRGQGTIRIQRPQLPFATLVAELDQLRALFEDAPAAIAVQRGPDHAYEFANAEYQRLIGWPREAQIVGQSSHAVLPDEAQLSGILEHVYTTGNDFSDRERAFRVVGSDGKWSETRWFDVLCRPLRDADRVVVGIVTFAVDVTQAVESRRRAEQAVARMEEKLDRLREAEARLLTAVKSREDFAQVASQELRAPISSLRLALEVLQREHDDLSPQRRARLVDRSVKQLAQLSALVGDLVDATRQQDVAAASARRQALNIDELVGDVLSRMREEARAAGVTLVHLPSSERPATGTWDRTALAQAFTRILADSVRAGVLGAIEVDVRATLDAVTVRVRPHTRGVGGGESPRSAAARPASDPAMAAAPSGGSGAASASSSYPSLPSIPALPRGASLTGWIVRQLIEQQGGAMTVDTGSDGPVWTVRLPRRATP